ncbi:ABC transporter ATP-binding protein [Aeromicrobium sp. YIM 150415]|uniref:ABC transporter ATP-binding protein n=1 Tax=Aeromicrobium sp. YIM 150415 TaxID=2803912 RepID=UPI001963900E|nr:ABC transporter ATP-binding protein [Aeromicrobium sp. YIM 150415]MBM9462285.1 ABC transporter ATP-binding protein [Aeromicrobium sp. YIM 150415]
MTAAERECVLEARSLSIGFAQDDDETAWVTQDVSFSVDAGETLAIVGESGSGKTVTAMAVLDLLPGNAVRSGEILFRGEDLVAASPERLRTMRGQDIAMVFQEPMTAFNPVYTVGRQISDAIRSHESISSKAASERAVDLLRLVGIPEPERRVKSFPHQLSGGQRQRAMIAMAIACRPAVLIADEPTTALDVTVQQEILQLLRRLQRELSMAIILITHDMGVVAEMADRVIVMRSGEVVERADVHALFEKPSHPYTRALLEAVPRIDTAAAESAPPEEASSLALEVSDLHVRYRGPWGRPGFLAVQDVSLTIGHGRMLGLVGESGSGKSTIGRAIVGLAPIEAGTVRINGRELDTSRSRQPAEVRRQYAMVFQDPASSLNPRVSIGESIAEPFVVHRRELSGRERRARVAELLEMVELPAEWESRFPHELSGGQRQRIGIARALALEPSLLIADEPTSALDVSVQAAVLRILQELQERLGFSCLFISHDLAVVELLADQVAVLQHGRLVESGATAQVLRHPREDYTRRLVEAAPVPDPVVQRQRASASERT